MIELSKTIKEISSFLFKTDGSLRDKTIRSGFWISVSYVGINILTVIRSIVLARLLMPEIFGLLAIYSIATRCIEVFSQTGFQAALIHRQESFDQAKGTAFTILVVRGIILALIAFSISPLVAAYYERTVLDAIIKVATIGFILRGFMNINIVALRKELNFKSLTYYQMIVETMKFAVVVTLVYFYRNVWALVIAGIIADLINTLMSFIIIPGKICFQFNRKIAKELFTYGKFITGATIMIFITIEIDNALIGKVLGMDALGYYVLAYTLANLPATHITLLAGGVMLPAYSKLQNDLSALRDAYLKVLKLVSTFSIPAAGGIAVFASEIVRIVYGEKWLPAVGALQVLCIFGMIRSIASTTGPIFQAIGKPNLVLYIVTGKLSLIALIIYPLTKTYGIVGTSYAISLSIMMEQFVLWVIIRNTIQLSMKRILKTVVSPICASSIMILLLICLKQIISVENIFLLIIFILSGIFIYFVSYLLINTQDMRSAYYQIREIWGPDYYGEH